jgi:murein DD-endopeptidase MepM/ murein hydrolase activator NlpD
MRFPKLLSGVKIFKIMKKYLILLIVGIFVTACIPVNQLDTAVNTDPDRRESSSVVVPVEEFATRITKKPFGIFITPETSPVQPERFSGYHTGVDAEYDDVEGEVAVFAITDGLVEYSGRVDGYGGLLAICHLIDNKEYLAIYGHLDPNSLVAKDQSVTKGQQIGVLGKGFSIETDGERKHLHFALYLGSDVSLKGYVQSLDQLSSWVDPKTILP